MREASLLVALQLLRQEFIVLRLIPPPAITESQVFASEFSLAAPFGALICFGAVLPWHWEKSN